MVIAAEKRGLSPSPQGDSPLFSPATRPLVKILDMGVARLYRLAIRRKSR